MFPRRDEHGMTVLELMVVVTIIGMLAAIAVPAYLNQRQRATDTSLRMDLRQAVLTQETIKATNMVEPGSQSPADFAVRDYKASPDTTVLVALHPGLGGYCILAANPGATRSYNNTSTALMAYDSVHGRILSYSVAIATGGVGIVPPDGACGPGRTTVTTVS